MPRRVERLAADALTSPIRITVGEVGAANEDIKQAGGRGRGEGGGAVPCVCVHSAVGAAFARYSGRRPSDAASLPHLSRATSADAPAERAQAANPALPCALALSAGPEP